MHFTCESCRATLQIADEKVKGKRLLVRCKRCGNKISIADPALAAGGAARAAAAAPAPSQPAPSQRAPQQQSALEHAPIDPDGDKGDSDTESTRAMETSVLEEALRVSKAAGEEAARASASAAKQAPAAPIAVPRDPPIWFAMIGGKQVGPVSRAELGLKTAQGTVGPRTYVWKEGMGAWQRAKDVGELSSLFADAPGTSAPAAAPPPVATQPPAASKPASAASKPASAASKPAPAASKPAPAASKPAPAASKPAPAASKPAPATSKPTPSKPSQLDLPSDGFKPFSLDEGGDSTNVESLPLGERVHQEKVGKALFSTGHDASGASAIDLARWASEELAVKTSEGDADATGQGEPVGDRTGAEPLVAGTSAAVATSRVGASYGFGAPGRETRGDAAAPSGLFGGRRTLFFVALGAAAALIAIYMLFGMNGSDPVPAVKAEVVSPGKAAAAQPPTAAAVAKLADKPAEPDKQVDKPAAVERDQEGADRRGGSQAPKEAAGDVAAATAGLTREVFDRVVSESRPAYKPCVDEALRRNPRLRVGKVLISIKIAPSGKVLDAAIDRRDAQESALGQCLLRTTKRIVFPPFQGEPTPGVIPLLIAGGE